MMKSNSAKLIECVPNFSEGRDISVIRAIYDSIICGNDCEIWDHSADIDHNRSVFTIAGTPECIESAVMRFVKTAAERIDMQTHQGVHPCIGAADVIPFVPLKNVSMSECIALAQKTGEKIAREYNLPVYLYAKAAKTPAHLRLADIRRGGYTKLQDEIATIPDRAPDFGPKFLPKAGGVSIGARDFLIAFNVYLEATVPEYAKKIASGIRESSGGFPGVQAIGLLVKGHAQVSMNLLDFRRTSLKTVFSAIKERSEELGTKVLYSELIGMLPEEALSGTSPDELMLRDFDTSRILENHY